MILNATATAIPLRTGSVHCVVTSPPYWGLRDYGLPPAIWGGDDECPHQWGQELPGSNRGGSGTPTDKNNRGESYGRDAGRGAWCQMCGAWRGQLGLEPTPDLYVEHLVDVFREIWRVLRDDGTLWLNLGDSYAGNNIGGFRPGAGRADGVVDERNQRNRNGNPRPPGLKPKDLVGIPWRVAFALQADGWYLRSDIVWCLSGGTRVYARTQKGDMPMTVKDLVRLRPETVQLWNGERWTQALGWSETPREETLEIELRSGERIGCTPHHEWPTTKGRKRADELALGDILIGTTLPAPELPATPAWLPDEDTGWLVGTYLADGSRDPGGTIQIASHRNEADRFARLARIAVACHATCRAHETSPNGVTVNLNGRVLAGIVDTYLVGGTAADKRLRTAAWQRSQDFLGGVLLGYLQGDGHYDAKNRRWRIGFTRNPRLAEDLRTLAARLGVTIRLRARWTMLDGIPRPIYRGEIRYERSAHHNARPNTEIVAIRRSRARRFWHVGVADEPHVFALASGVLTGNSKPNPMPESVTDRPTKAHEYVFLLAKRERYYYDAEAIKEPSSGLNGGGFSRSYAEAQPSHGAMNLARPLDSGSRNRRTVWEIATQPYPEAHFATFPEALVEPCVMAGTSERGVCRACGAQWGRVSGRAEQPEAYEDRKYDRADPKFATKRNMGARYQAQLDANPVITTGWQPSCACAAPTTQPLVLDPFAGSGTVGQVCHRLGRRFVGTELNPKYCRLAYDRTAQLGLI